MLLEGICFFMVVQFNKKQEQIFFYSYNKVAGAINDWVDSWRDYIFLDKAIKELREENAQLRSQLEMLGFSEDMALDSVDNDSVKFVYLGADIVNKTILGNNNTLTLDKGRRDGVEKHMGVISPEGVVGIVTNVSDGYAGVMTILHKESRISASIKRNGYFGSLIWDGKDPMRASLETMPKHASLQIGDTIQTSGYSNIFPPGIMIGTIENFTLDDGANNYNVVVKLINDICKIQQAYIIINNKKEDLQDLETD